MTSTIAGQELEVVDHDARALTVGVKPDVEAAELVARLAVIRQAMETAMTPDIDYGVIPGTGSKPTLLKPGAEKLGALFQLDVQLDNEKIWHDDGHLTVICRATVFHQPTGARLGSGEGICTTRETRYAFRNGERVCPACGATAIIKGKAEYGGGWLCWNKPERGKNGCGAKFEDGDPAVEQQTVGKVPNENLADTFNTVDKIASKRARVDAVLAVTGASALFTQDVEDLPHIDHAPTLAAPQAPTAERAVTGGASDSQLRFLANLVGKCGVAYEVPADLSKQEASRLIEALKAGDTSVLGAALEVCGECGGVNGEHDNTCSESIPF